MVANGVAYTFPSLARLMQHRYRFLLAVFGRSIWHVSVCGPSESIFSFSLCRWVCRLFLFLSFLLVPFRVFRFDHSFNFPFVLSPSNAVFCPVCYIRRVAANRNHINDHSSTFPSITKKNNPVLFLALTAVRSPPVQ